MFATSVAVKRRVDRHHDRAQLEYREVDDGVLGAIVRHHGDAVAALHAQPLEGAAQLGSSARETCGRSHVHCRRCTAVWSPRRRA